MAFKIIASLLTGIGGHFLNRRWDKAILFLSLFVLYGLGIFLFLAFYAYQNVFPGSMEDIGKLTELLKKAFAGGIFVIWLISNIETIRDSRSGKQPSFDKWTKPGIAAASSTTLFSILILLLSIHTLRPADMHYAEAEGGTGTVRSTYSYSHSFYEYLYLGGSPSRSDNLPGPPTGEGALRGKITFEGKPAEGVKLSVVLNGKYNAKDIVTDEAGIFSLNLPPGEWTVNAIQTEAWSNNPRGDDSYSIYYGGEAKLTSEEYNPYNYFKNKGYPVRIKKDSDKIHIDLTISKDLELIWPDPKRQQQKAITDDVIAWKEYPDATQYYLEISKITREGRTTRFQKVTSRHLAKSTSLPLSDLKHVKTQAKEDLEYGATIYAFDKNGKLIAEFSEIFTGGTFTLSDGNILVEDQLQSVFDTDELSSDLDIEEATKRFEAVNKNRGRVDAVNVLIDDNLLIEAESLIEKIDPEYAKGQKEVLSGKVYALLGQCEKAVKMFRAAENITPEACIPDEYRQMCE